LGLGLGLGLELGLAWPPTHLQRYESVEFPRFPAAYVQSSVERGAKAILTQGGLGLGLGLGLEIN